MKKVLSILIAIALLCMMAIPALAAEPTTYTLTITGAAGHTYNVYQIYTGDISKEGATTVLSNVKYGQNHYPVNGKVGDPVPADELATLTDGQTAIDTLLAGVKNGPIAEKVTPTNGETSVVIEGLVPGYYMVVDVSTDLPEGQTKSTVILRIVESVSIASKHTSITSEKKVDDKNDSNTSEDAVAWQDSADYDIGDTVPFKLSCTVPATYSAYEDYTITFHDAQDAGFGDPSITKVYVANKAGTEVSAIAEATGTTSGYTLATTCGHAECDFGSKCSFTVTVGDLNDLITGYAEGYQIVVEYTAVLE